MEKGRYIYIFNFCSPKIAKSLKLNQGKLCKSSIVIDIKDGTVIKNRYGKIGKIKDLEEINKPMNEPKKWKRENIYDGMFVQSKKDETISKKENSNNSIFCQTCTFYKKIGKKACECCDYDKIFHDNKMIDKEEKNKFNIDDIILKNNTNHKFKIEDIAKYPDGNYIYKIGNRFDHRYDQWVDEKHVLENYRKLKYYLYDKVLLKEKPYRYEIVDFCPCIGKDYALKRYSSDILDVVFSDIIYVNEDEILKVVMPSINREAINNGAEIEE